MSRVIKAGGATGGLAIAPLDSCLPLGPLDAVPASPLVDPLAEENARLRARIGELEARISAHHEAVASARKEGEDAGRLAVEREREESRNEALQRLERGILQAQEALKGYIGSAETLALLIAQAALDKLFGEGAERQRLLADLIRRQVDQIDRRSLVAIEVSRRDFPDTGEVAELAARLNIERAIVSVSEEIDAGACSMRLTLGTLEVGLDQQWGAVRSLLDTFLVADERAE